jgi:hypothetical protein
MIYDHADRSRGLPRPADLLPPARQEECCPAASGRAANSTVQALTNRTLWRTEKEGKLAGSPSVCPALFCAASLSLSAGSMGVYLTLADPQPSKLDKLHKFTPLHRVLEETYKYSCYSRRTSIDIEHIHLPIDTISAGKRALAHSAPTPAASL